VVTVIATGAVIAMRVFGRQLAGTTTTPFERRRLSAISGAGALPGAANDLHDHCDHAFADGRLGAG
jgi:hypothetical protein